MRRDRHEPIQRPRVDRLVNEPTETALDPRDLMTPELWQYLRRFVGADRKPIDVHGSSFVSDIQSMMRTGADDQQLSDEDVTDRYFPSTDHDPYAMVEAAITQLQNPREKLELVRNVFLLQPAVVRKLSIPWNDLVASAEEDTEPSLTHSAFLTHNVFSGISALAFLQVAAIEQQARFVVAPEYLDQAWAMCARDTENYVSLIPTLRALDSRPYDADRLQPIAESLRRDLEQFLNPSREPDYQLRIIAALDAVEARNYRVTTQGLEIERQGAPVHDAPALPTREV